MTPRPFSCSTLVGEAWRNLRSRWVLTALVVVTAATGGAATVLLGAGDVASIRARWDDQVAGGKFVYEVTGAGTSRVDAAKCDAVQGWRGVRAAGGRNAVVALRPVTSPGSRFDLDLVTPGYLGVLWPDVAVPSAGEVVAGPHAAETLGLRSGTSVASYLGGSSQAELLAVVTVPEERSLRDEGADRHFFAVAPPAGTVDRCLVDIEPSSSVTVRAALGAWFDSGTTEPPRPVHDFARAGDPEADLHTRASRGVWAGAAVLVGTITVTTWTIRRSDAALYRLLGARAGSVAVLVGADAVVALLTPALAGIAAALVVAAPDLTDDVVRDIVLRDAARFLLLLALLPVACTGIVATRSVFITLKEQ